MVAPDRERLRRAFRVRSEPATEPGLTADLAPDDLRAFLRRRTGHFVEPPATRCANATPA